MDFSKVDSTCCLKKCFFSCIVHYCCLCLLCALKKPRVRNFASRMHKNATTCNFELVTGRPSKGSELALYHLMKSKLVVWEIHVPAPCVWMKSVLVHPLPLLYFSFPLPRETGKQRVGEREKNMSLEIAAFFPPDGTNKCGKKSPPADNCTFSLFTFCGKKGLEKPRRFFAPHPSFFSQFRWRIDRSAFWQFSLAPLK